MLGVHPDPLDGLDPRRLVTLGPPVDLRLSVALGRLDMARLARGQPQLDERAHAANHSRGPQRPLRTDLPRRIGDALMSQQVRGDADATRPGRNPDGARGPPCRTRCGRGRQPDAAASTPFDVDSMTQRHRRRRQISRRLLSDRDDRVRAHSPQRTPRRDTDGHSRRSTR